MLNLTNIQKLIKFTFSFVKNSFLYLCYTQLLSPMKSELIQILKLSLMSLRTPSSTFLVLLMISVLKIMLINKSLKMKKK